MRQVRNVLVLLLALGFWQSVFATESTKPVRVKLAREFVKQLDQGEFEKAVQRFDTVMSKALPSDNLKVIWNGLISQYGSFQGIKDTRTEDLKKYKIVFVTCQFERVKLDAKVVFTEQNEISGLFFVPTGAYRVPGYVDRKSFEEVEVTVGKGLWAVPGTLSLPQGDKPVQAIVLVHGSGPHDRDETIGPNKPFP